MLNGNFYNRWTSTASLGKYLSVRYKLENLTTSKATISHTLGKIDPSIDDLTANHKSNIYRGTNRNEKYSFFQDLAPDSPIFSCIRNNEAVWDNIRRFGRIEVDGYINYITHSQSRQCSNKKRKIDEVDMMHKFISISKETEGLPAKAAKHYCDKIITQYWDSPEAYCLSCLVKR